MDRKKFALSLVERFNDQGWDSLSSFFPDFSVFYIKLTEEEKTSILTKHDLYKQSLNEEVDPKVRIAISKCFVENNCQSKVDNLLATNNMFKNLPQGKKNRLIKSCSEGPKTEHEEFFCRMALSMCGIENPNNCIAEKIK